MPKSAPASPPSATRQKASHDILVIEDDVDIRDVLIQILEDEGYKVSGAENGAHALELLHNEVLPRLILLDLMMPVMSGWQFRQALDQHPAFGNIPVVVLTADHLNSEQRHSLQVEAILSKPVQLTTLLAAVSGLIGPPQAVSTSSTS